MYKYLRGSRDSREIVEFDISKRGQYITTCVVDVDLLLCGILSFPCGNGDDVTLTGQRQLDILELVQAEREKITSGIEVKTMESWYGSGLNFDDYCFPGDTVGEDIVDYFVNVVSPVTLRYDCMQAGEEHSCEPDGSGKYRATYTTFHRTGDGRFRFDGYCFKGENQNRVEKTYSQQRFEKRLAEAREEAERDG
ncbi:hypothetical protein [uncultured Oscillibacter sp.]|uniref:hypothetical protein n=1 Tax=uncultured Oscillibacter sp. TaxID=876091 RepID=UPI00272A5C03|nr:hypothetical protein [uncultured Oscillibacter sp.]